MVLDVFHYCRLWKNYRSERTVLSSLLLGTGKCNSWCMLASGHQKGWDRETNYKLLSYKQWEGRNAFSIFLASPGNRNIHIKISDRLIFCPKFKQVVFLKTQLIFRQFLVSFHKKTECSRPEGTSGSCLIIIFLWPWANPWNKNVSKLQSTVSDLDETWMMWRFESKNIFL